MASNELQKLKPGETAKASILNENFEYLDNRATDIDSYAHSVATTAATNLNNVNSTLTKKTNDLDKAVKNAQKTADNATNKAKSAAGGLWVWKKKEIRDGETTVGSRSFNVKDYISNDGNMYELYIHAYMRDDSSTKKYCRISSTSFGNNADTGITFCQLVTGGYADISVNDFILPAKSSDKIFYTLTGGTVDFLQIRILGYRKLGTA